MTIKSKFDTPELEKLLTECGFTKDYLSVWRKSDKTERQDYAVFISDMPAVDDYVMIQTTPWDTKKYIGTSQAYYDMDEIFDEIRSLA